MVLMFYLLIYFLGLGFQKSNNSYIASSFCKKSLLISNYTDVFCKVLAFKDFGKPNEKSLLRVTLKKNEMNRGGSRAAATSKMECFVIIVNGF